MQCYYSRISWRLYKLSSGTDCAPVPADQNYSPNCRRLLYGQNLITITMAETNRFHIHIGCICMYVWNGFRPVHLARTVKRIKCNLCGLLFINYTPFRTRERLGYPIIGGWGLKNRKSPKTNAYECFPFTYILY